MPCGAGLKQPTAECGCARYPTSHPVVLCVVACEICWMLFAGCACLHGLERACWGCLGLQECRADVLPECLGGGAVVLRVGSMSGWMGVCVRCLPLHFHAWGVLLCSFRLFAGPILVVLCPCPWRCGGGLVGVVLAGYVQSGLFLHLSLMRLPTFLRLLD